MKTAGIKKNQEPQHFFFILDVEMYCQCDDRVSAIEQYAEKNTVFAFEDIDIAVAAEMQHGDESVPRMIVIRNTTGKSIADINQEINDFISRNKKEEAVTFDDRGTVSMLHFVMRLPRFVRLILWRRFMRNPLFVRKNLGTVGVMSLGMFGKASGFAVPIPTTSHAISFAPGSILEKPVAVKGELAIREILHITIFIDHDIADGAPAARFINYLKKMVESGSEL